jgi:hypothetical protein
MSDVVTGALLGIGGTLAGTTLGPLVKAWLDGRAVQSQREHDRIAAVDEETRSLVRSTFAVMIEARRKAGGAAGWIHDFTSGNVQDSTVSAASIRRLQGLLLDLHGELASLWIALGEDHAAVKALQNFVLQLAPFAERPFAVKRGGPADGVAEELTVAFVSLEREFRAYVAAVRPIARREIL